MRVSVEQDCVCLKLVYLYFTFNLLFIENVVDDRKQSCRVRRTSSDSRSTYRLLATANSKVQARDQVEVADKVSHIWDKFAAFLAPEKFNSAGIKVINSDHKDSFTRALAVLEKWSSSYSEKATCRVLIATLLDVGLKAQACDVFGKELVEFVQQQKQPL